MHFSTITSKAQIHMELVSNIEQLKISNTPIPFEEKNNENKKVRLQIFSVLIFQYQI